MERVGGDSVSDQESAKNHVEADEGAEDDPPGLPGWSEMVGEILPARGALIGVVGDGLAAMRAGFGRIVEV